MGGDQNMIVRKSNIQELSVPIIVCYVLFIILSGMLPSIGFSADDQVFSSEIKSERYQAADSQQRPPSPAVAVTLTALIPGAGDLYLGHSDWWLFTLGTVGSVYGATYYAEQTDCKEQNCLHAHGLLGVGLFLWAYDIWHVYNSAVSVRDRRAFKAERFNFIFDPEFQGVRISLNF